LLLDGDELFCFGCFWFHNGAAGWSLSGLVFAYHEWSILVFGFLSFEAIVF
jgi:hypothetical protein